MACAFTHDIFEMIAMIAELRRRAGAGLQGAAHYRRLRRDVLHARVPMACTFTHDIFEMIAMIAELRPTC